MTKQEIEEQLKKLGLSEGSWNIKEPGQEIPAGDLFKTHVELIQKIEALLEEELKKSRDQLADLNIALNKAKYGSGG